MPLKGPIGTATGGYAGRKLLLLASAQLRVACAKLLDKGCINLDLNGLHVDLGLRCVTD